MNIHEQYIHYLSKEIDAREKAYNSLIDFTRYTMPKYRASKHHILLCKTLEAVDRGEINRLMVFMPPRHGKSELISKRFPAWYLGRKPENQFIASSYSAKLSDSFGRDVRNIVSSSRFKNIFPGVELASDSKAKDLWGTKQGGVFLSAGIGGSMTGYGGDIAIIDDPIKDRQDAESSTIRENAWDWYRSVLRTRIMPGGAIIIVQTRWHVDDLSGRLINEMKNNSGEDWEILHLPAIATTNDDILGRKIGDPLWKEAYGLKELESIKKSVGVRDWESLYQGEPIITTGGMFKTDNMPIIDELPPASATVRRWDLAASDTITSYDPDRTSGVKMQRDKDGSYTIIDVIRFAETADIVEKRILQTAKNDTKRIPILLPQDPGQAGKSQFLYFVKLLAGYNVIKDIESGDKVTRADPLASQINNGNVKLMRGAWNQDFIDELKAFPNGGHDDQVDAAAGAFNNIFQSKSWFDRV